MKTLSGAGVLGLLAGLALVYWLRPNTGGTGLVLLVSISSGIALGAAISRKRHAPRPTGGHLDAP